MTHALLSLPAWTLLFGLAFSLGPSSPQASHAAEPLLKQGDRLALIGGTLVESLQFQGDCEVSLALARPELRVPFRNLGWSGDDASGTARRVFGSTAEGYARLFSDLSKADPTVALIGYGWAEASQGESGVAAFKPALLRLGKDLQERQIRLVFLQPFELPGVRTPGYADHMRNCRQIVAEVAAELQATVLDSGRSLTADAFDQAGLRLNAAGKRKFGQTLAADLLGQPVGMIQAAARQPGYAVLSEQVAAKNALFFHRHRPMNETYLFLFRKHEQGNNAPEVASFEPLVESAEQAIWNTAEQTSKR